jgi:copper oxidase (laccase) domain-containing protein
LFEQYNNSPLGAAVTQKKIDDREKNFVSLQAANAALLAGAGVRNIAYCSDCTFTDERLGSFRREGGVIVNGSGTGTNSTGTHYTKMMALVKRN